MPGREIPVLGEYDVIVMGGGTAGAFAGIAASRRGSRTLIIEQFGALGGSATREMCIRDRTGAVETRWALPNASGKYAASASRYCLAMRRPRIIASDTDFGSRCV